MHIDGLEYDVTSSGDQLGSNTSSAVAQGQTVHYRYYVPDDRREEGGHYIHPGPGHRALVDHGLFGSFIVEPPGSTYWDASNVGQPLESGWEAIIKPGAIDAACVVGSQDPTCGFREAVLLHHEFGNDNETLTDKFGAKLPLVDDTTGSYRPGEFALNYRSEPFRHRLLDFPKEKSHAYSSYTFGEPATPMMRGYLADPTKIRLMHVGAEKFHIYHLHGGGDRWRFNPVADPAYDYADTGLEQGPGDHLSPSQRLDSQSIGPGESYNVEIEGGAGGVQQSAGDFLYHCHIAKHYVSGMWSFWRVYDTLQPDLVPLADRPLPPTAVDSTGLIGRTIGNTKITSKNLDSWIRPQLPPSGVPGDGADATVMDWKVAGTSSKPLYLGAPADPTVYTDSPRGFSGQPNLLAIDQTHMVGNRPAILVQPGQRQTGVPVAAHAHRHPTTRSPPTGTAVRRGSVRTPTSPRRRAPIRRPGGRTACARPGAPCAPTTWSRSPSRSAVRRPSSTPTARSSCSPRTRTGSSPTATGASPWPSVPTRGTASRSPSPTRCRTTRRSTAFSKVSMHIHHVQFDVQGSDGVSAGYAYEHSVRPYQVGLRTLTSAAAKGTTTLHLSSTPASPGPTPTARPPRSGSRSARAPRASTSSRSAR